MRARPIKKYKMADGTPGRLCVSHFLFNGADFCGRGRVLSSRQANRVRSRFGKAAKLVHGVIGPIQKYSMM